MSSAARWFRVPATTRNNQADANSSILESHQTHKNMLLMIQKADFITIMKVEDERTRSVRSPPLLNVGVKTKSGIVTPKVKIWTNHVAELFARSYKALWVQWIMPEGWWWPYFGDKSHFSQRNGWATTVGAGAKNTKTS